jgi:hypothetical protein
MLFLLMVFILISSPLMSDQLIRESWTYETENKILYRISEEQFLTELMVRTDQKGDTKPAYFIWDSPSIQFGSFDPSGLWKFMCLSSLISDSTLRQNHGLVPNRNNLNPFDPISGAFLWSHKGGVLARKSEGAIQSALWQEYSITAYTSMTLGLSVLFPDSQDALEDSWFENEVLQDDHPVYHPGMDIKNEGRNYRFHFQGGGSFSENRIPGFSFLPVYTYFGDSWDLTGRYWYNSEFWVNQSLDRVNWVHYWDSKANVIPTPACIMTLLFYQGFKDDGSTPWDGVQFKGEMTPGPFSFLFEFTEDREPLDESILRVKGYRLKVAVRTGLWRSQLEGEIAHDDSGILKWSLIPEVKRSRKQGGHSRLSCPVRAEIGTTSILPQWEESFYIGSFSLKGKTGYEFVYPRENRNPSEAISLRLQLEWSH